MNDNFSVSWKYDLLKCKFHAFKSNDWILRQTRKVDPFKIPTIEVGAAYLHFCFHSLVNGRDVQNRRTEGADFNKVRLFVNHRWT